MRKTKQTRKPRKVAKKTRKPRKTREFGLNIHKSSVNEAFRNHPMAVSDVEFEEPEVIAITMPKHRAARIAHDLSDLLCWWQGFKAAVRMVNPDRVYTDMAQNGIEASRDLNLMLKDKLR